MSAPAGSDRIVAGRYRLIEPLGSGGMGTVWLAQDELLRRRVAAKEIFPPAGMTANERSTLRHRTLREAQTAARLNHPNVVAIYDVAEDHGRPWIIMELIQARSLREVVEQDGPLDPPAAARVGLQVLAALRSAHALGIMHRDVKPGNVLIEADGRAVLADFGIARADDSTATTASGVLVGSPSYIAPERAQGDRGGPASDLWSLGATLYAAVEGRPPYDRAGALATLMAVVSDPPDPPRRAGSMWPVISGLLAADQARRLGADEAEQLLRRAADPGLAAVMEPGTAGAEPGSVPVTDPGAAGAEPGSAPVTDPGAAGAEPGSAPFTAPMAAAAPPATVELAAADGQPPAGTLKRAERTRAFHPSVGPEPEPALTPAPLTASSSQRPASPPPPASSESARSFPTAAPPQPTEPHEPAPLSVASAPSSGPETSPTEQESSSTSGPVPEPAPDKASEAEPAPAPASWRGPATADEHASAWPDPGRRPPARRRGRVVTAIVAVAALAVAGTVLGLQLAGRPATRPSASGRASHSATAPATPASSAPASPAPRSTPPAAKSSAPAAFGTAAPVPPGYRTYHDPTGFSIAMPDSWKVSHQGGYVYLTPPSGGAFLLIDQSDHPLPDPLANWLQQEANRRSTYPGYHRVRLVAIDYPQAEKAADWEFTYIRGGVLTHVLNRNVLANARHAYALYWSTPQAEWASELPVFTVLARTFQPAS
jgi:eukaryotic-like serine/threonine-protein kinase